MATPTTTLALLDPLALRLSTRSVPYSTYHGSRVISQLTSSALPLSPHTGTRHPHPTSHPTNPPMPLPHSAGRASRALQAARLHVELADSATLQLRCPLPRHLRCLDTVEGDAHGCGGASCSDEEKGGDAGGRERKAPPRLPVAARPAGRASATFSASGLHTQAHATLTGPGSPSSKNQSVAASPASSECSDGGVPPGWRRSRPLSSGSDDADAM
jgi:hypothetical protein